jgi:hypothetical protein
MTYLVPAIAAVEIFPILQGRGRFLTTLVRSNEVGRGQTIAADESETITTMKLMSDAPSLPGFPSCRLDNGLRGVSGFSGRMAATVGRRESRYFK